ncbi:hypothetical protein B0H11DRAFT_1995880 [Mycena galericulata]|nr:hypothetical protein B0H11DRAFT_1995880 [Mycena galericulata]
MLAVDLPLDILLEITQDLDLPDSLQLAATCSSYMTILLSPTFWIRSLKRIEEIHRRPLPCSPGTDLQSLTLVTLRILAVHAYKLRKNWTSEYPYPVSVRSFEMKDQLLNLFSVEGTRMIITVSLERVACWDTISGECIGTFDRDTVGPPWVASSSPLLLPGMCSVGMAVPTSEHDVELAVICFDYRDPSAVRVTKVFSRIWNDIPFASSLVSNVIVNEGIIGAILPESHEYLICRLLFARLEDEDVHCVPLELNPNAAHPSGIALDDGFYLTRQSFDPIVEIIHVNTLAPLDNGKFRMHTVTKDVPLVNPEQETFSLGSCRIRYPKYGVLNVTLRSSESTIRGLDIDTEIHELHFWPAEHDGSNLTIGSLCSYEHSYPMVWLTVGSSATCGIILDENDALGLIQYVPQPTPHVEFRHLPLAVEKITSMYNEIALDDRLGVLYMVEGGRMMVVSYA